MCSDADQISSLGLPVPSLGCSPCTSFFFQRHGNGHEICGFFTSDLNSATVNMDRHGHDDGSRVCVKEKLQMSLPVDSSVEGREAETARLVLEQLGWSEPVSCGVEHVRITVNEPDNTKILGEEGLLGLGRTLIFRVNLDGIPMDGEEEIIEYVTEWFQSGIDEIIAENNGGGRGRRRAQEAGGFDFEDNVGVVGMCLKYSCSDQMLLKKGDSPAFCEGLKCDRWECCDMPEGLEVPCKEEEDCPEEYECDMGGRRSGLRGRKPFGDVTKDTHGPASVVTECVCVLK